MQVPEVGPKAYRGLGSHAPLPPQRLAQGATPPWQVCPHGDLVPHEFSLRHLHCCSTACGQSEKLMCTTAQCLQQQARHSRLASAQCVVPADCAQSGLLVACTTAVPAAAGQQGMPLIHAPGAQEQCTVMVHCVHCIHAWGPPEMESFTWVSAGCLQALLSLHEAGLPGLAREH